MGKRQIFLLRVAPGLTIVGNPPGGTEGVAYSHDLDADGGTAPYTFSIVGGALPDGLSLNTSTGEISGTPTTAGDYAFTVQAQDSVGETANAAFSVSIAAGVQTYDDLMLALNPLGYWKLDETSGSTAADSSGNGNDLTFGGTFTLDQSPLCADGRSVLLGSDGRINSADNTTFTNQVFTLMAWVDWPNTSVNKYIFDTSAYGVGGHQEAQLRQNSSNKVHGVVRTTAAANRNITTPTSFTSGARFIVFVADVSGNVGKIYVDGQLEHTDDFNNETMNESPNYPLTIGAVQTGASSFTQFWARKIQRAAYIAGIVTDQEVLDLYNKGIGS